DGATTFIPNRNIAALKNYSYKERTVNLDVPVTSENLIERKNQIMEVNANYPQLKYLGIINIEDKLFLRTSLTVLSLYE
ncbi:potassium transporter KefA, partial [Lactococcus lactis]